MPSDAPEGAPGDARREWIAVTSKVTAPWDTAWRWMHGQFPPEDVSAREVRQFWSDNRPYEDDAANEVVQMLAARIEGPWHLEVDRDEDGATAYRLTRRSAARGGGDGNSR